jgi:cell division protein FtsB
LADVLALVFETYNEHKNDNLEEFSAKVCARWIEKVRIFGVVTSKLRDCNSEKEQLQKTIDEISDRNIHLEFENRDLHSKLEESEKFQRVFR